MTSLRSLLLSAIAFLQMAGGGALLGIFIFVVIPTQFRSPQANLPLDLAIDGLFIILAVLSIWAGLLLWKRRSLGFSLSAALQFLQIPYIKLTSFLYTLQASLLNLTISATSDAKINVTPEFGVQGYLSWATGQPGPHAIGINIVAVILLILILSLRRLEKND